MKWYGVEISKFCGVSISSKPKLEPIFSIPMNRLNRVGSLVLNSFDIDNFEIKINKNKKNMTVGINEYAEISFKIPVIRKNRKMCLTHIEEV